VLRVKSGDTVEIQTLITSSPKRLEDAGCRRIRWSNLCGTLLRKLPTKGLGGTFLVGRSTLRTRSRGMCWRCGFRRFGWQFPMLTNAFGAGRGYIPDDFPYSKMKIIPLDEKRMVARFAPGIEIPLHPFFGSMGNAPPEAAGRFNSAPPWIMGGTWTTRIWWRGRRCICRCTPRGLWFEVGDGHAGQGDGEVDITAIETSLVGRFSLWWRKDMHLKWPRAETPTQYMTMDLMMT